MGAMAAVEIRADGKASRGSSVERACLVEQAEDFAALLLQAVGDALDAMAHPVPDQYLHLLSAHRRSGLAIDDRAEAAELALAKTRNAAVVNELGSHLAFEILNSARRYANLLGSIGDYRQPPDLSAVRDMRTTCAASP